MKMVVWLKDASLFQAENLEKKIKKMEGVDDVVSIIGDEAMRLSELEKACKADVKPDTAKGGE